MKRIVYLVIGMAFILSSTSVCLAQMGGKEQGKMMGKCMKGEKMCPMHGCGMMGRKMLATSDGGIVVMICNKLYKYDKDLNLKKEVEIPVDKDQMRKMKEMGMPGGTTKGDNK